METKYINISSIEIEGWEQVDATADLPLEDGQIYDQVHYITRREDHPTIIEFVLACEHKGKNVRYIYAHEPTIIIDFKCCVYGDSKERWTILDPLDEDAHKVIEQLTKLSILIHKSTTINAITSRYYYNLAIKMFCDRFMTCNYDTDTAMCFMDFEDYRKKCMTNMNKAYIASL